MKTKLLICSAIIVLLLLVAKCGYSQTWYGNNPTFTSGTYNAGYTGTAIIQGNVTFTNGGSLSAVDVQPQATLTLQQSVEFYNGSTIESGGTIYAQSDLALDLTNTISGSLYVTGTLTSNNQGEVLSGCAFIQTDNLTVHNDNLFSGTGIIYITGTYNSETGSNYHPLTASNTILVNYTGAWEGFGAAQPTTNTASICSTLQPVTITGQSVTESSDEQVTFSWTSTIESNVKYYIIKGSVDGKTFVDVDTVNSYWPTGTSSVAHPYSVTFDNSLIVTTAGICGLLVILGLAIGLIKKRKLATVLSLFAFSFAIYSCTKHTDVSKSVTSKYKYFYLTEVDQDGTVNYFQPTFSVK